MRKILHVDASSHPFRCKKCKQPAIANATVHMDKAGFINTVHNLPCGHIESATVKERHYQVRWYAIDDLSDVEIAAALLMLG